jgi:hypothetical protein
MKYTFLLLTMLYSSVVFAELPHLMNVQEEIPFGHIKAEIKAQLANVSLVEFSRLQKTGVLQKKSALYKVSGTTTYLSESVPTSLGIYFGSNSSSGLVTEDAFSNSIAKKIFPDFSGGSFSYSQPDWLDVPPNRLVSRAKIVADFFKNISPKESTVHLSHLTQKHTCHSQLDDRTLCLKITFIDPTPYHTPDTNHLYIIVEEYEQ